MTSWIELPYRWVSDASSKRHFVNRLLMLPKTSVAIILAASIAGCFGPLMNHESARSTGNGHNSIKLIASGIGYGFKYDHGFGDNFDVGYSLETYSSGISAKYAFVNNERGGAFATKAGYGVTLGGNYYLGSIIGSYRGNNWEPFLNLQFTRVTIDEQDVKDANTGDVFVTTPKFNYDYTQAFGGMKYWFNQRFALSLEASSFIASHDVEIKGDFVSLSADFAY